MSNDIAILGVGMHPWGKWGKNFSEYGVHAARAALKDAGIPWQDVGFVSGAATMRCGYPGYVAGATFAQALGWQGAQVIRLTPPVPPALRRSPPHKQKFLPANAKLP